MKNVCLIVLIIFGFFMMPEVTFACNSHSEKKSCDKTASAKTEKMNCCNMDCCKNDSHSKKNNHSGCNGKCGHYNCITTSTQFGAVFFEIDFKNNNFDFSEKKQNYFNSNTNLSSGFHSLWLIPKIG